MARTGKQQTNLSDRLDNDYTGLKTGRQSR